MRSEIAARLLALALSLVLSGIAAAQPRFIAVTAERELPAGVLLEIGKDWSIRVAGAGPKRIAAADLIELRASDHRPPLFPREHFLLFANGDRLPLRPGSRAALENDRLQVDLAAPLETQGSSQLEVVQAAAAMLVRQPPDPAHDPAHLWARLQREQAAHDVVLQKNGDRLEGTLTGIQAAAILQLGQRRVEVKWDNVAAVVFNSELQARPKLKKLHAHVILRNGARLTFTALTLTPPATLTGLTPYGVRLEFPLEQLVHLEVSPGRIVYLSDLTPREWKHTPFLDRVHPLARDANLAGKPLELGGAGYEKGLAMACRGEATYELGGRFRWFEAIVGVDPSASKGRLRFQVLLDGKAIKVGERERVAADAPTPLRLEVRGAGRLTLITDWGSRGNVQGFGVWANARLIR